MNVEDGQENICIQTKSGSNFQLNISLQKISKFTNISEKFINNLDFKLETFKLYQKYLDMRENTSFKLKEDCQNVLLYDKFELNIIDKKSMNLIKGLNYFLLVELIKLAEYFKDEELHTYLCAFIAHYYKNLKYSQLHDTFLIGSCKFTGDELKTAILLTPTLNDYCNKLAKQ